jgi:hypothetical protein
MKPTYQISQQTRSHHGEERPVGLRQKHPATDCHYQPTGGDFPVTNNPLKRRKLALSPSFRQLSSEFLSGEMKRDYRAEAACFIIMISVSAWPIVSVVRALSWLK